MVNASIVLIQSSFAGGYRRPMATS